MADTFQTTGKATEIKGKHFLQVAKRQLEDRLIKPDKLNSVPSRVFLLTDLVNSSSKWSREPEAMSLDLKKHDEIIHSIVHSNHGAVFKHTGDGFLATFLNRSQAIETAKEIQNQFSFASWQTIGGLSIKVAIVEGNAEERDGDFFGQTLNLLSRLSASLGPSQSALIGLIESPTEPSLRSIGVHSYRGIEGTFRVFEIESEVFSPSPQRLRPRLTLREPHRHSTGFIGRQKEIALVIDRLRQSPIVTLVGPGGIGKTRLANEIAQTTNLIDGAAWVSLGSGAKEGNLELQIWRSVSAEPPPSENLQSALCQLLQGSELLIVLDSVDSWRDEVSEVLPQICRQVEGVRFLLTSRSPLGSRTERVVPVPPLSSQDAGLHLFLDRAANARGVSISSQEEIVAIELVEKLEGIPLAIEIVACRISTIPIQQLRTLIFDDEFIMRSGQRGRIERHQTLESAFDWTFRTLDSNCQITFCAASQFHGAFSLESLVDLLSPYLSFAEVSTSVAILTEHSMIQLRQDEYSVLDTLRAYGSLKMRDLGLDSSIKEATDSWAMRTADSARVSLKGPEASAVTEMIAARRIELRNSAQDFIDNRSLEEAAKIVSVLWRMWYRKGEINAGLESLEPLWQKLKDADDLGVRRAYGWALYLSGRLQDAQLVASESRLQAINRNLIEDQAQSLNLLAGIHSALGEHHKALEFYNQSITLIDSSVFGVDLLRLRLNAASMKLQLGLYQESLIETKECLRGFRELGDHFAEAWSLLNIGINLILLKNFEEAESVLQESKSIRQELGDRRGVLYCKYGLALLESERGNLLHAKELANEASDDAVTLADSFAIGAGLVLQVRIAMVEKSYRLIATILARLPGDPPGRQYASSQDDLQMLKSAEEIISILIPEQDLIEIKEKTVTIAPGKLLTLINENKL